VLTSFHTAQAPGTDWQAIGRALYTAMPQPCHGSLGLLFGTPALHDDLPSIALMLRGTTKIPYWHSITTDGIMGFPIDALGAAVLIIPFAPPHATFAASDQAPTTIPEPAVTLRHGEGGGQTTTPGFALGAYFTAATPAASTINFSPAIAIASGVTQSCLPMGATHSVTRARGTLITTIDDLPAQEIMRREIGAMMVRSPADWRERIFVGLPERGHDRNDYRTIAITALETDGGISVAEPIETGRRILFTARSAAGATHDLQQMLRHTLARCPTPRAALYYSTTARQALFNDALYHDAVDELALLHAALPPKTPRLALYADAIVSGRRTHHDAGLLILFG
jgi:hypothetical protein